MHADRTDLVELLALHTLSRRPLHGYGVYKELEPYFEDLSNGRIYGVLGRLEDEGLVRSEDEEGRRRVYELTDDGRSRLDAIARAPEALKAAIASLFDVEGAEPVEGDLGPWQDIRVHRDLVRDTVTIELEKGEGDTPPEVERLLREVLGAILR